MKNMIRPFVLILALLGSLVSATAAECSTAAAARAKPTVVVIRADWCPGCKALEPGMGPLVGKYSDRLDFVVLDITSDETKAQSAAKAKEAGLGDFFATNATKGTPCVAIVSSQGKEVFHKVGSTDLALYDKAFAQAAAAESTAR